MNVTEVDGCHNFLDLVIYRRSTSSTSILICHVAPRSFITSKVHPWVPQGKVRAVGFVKLPDMQALANAADPACEARAKKSASVRRGRIP